jgi:hypothetical protein
MTLAEHFEQQLGARLGERHIAKFVDDQQFDGGELRLQPQQTFFIARFHELMYQPRRRREGH